VRCAPGTAEDEKLRGWEVGKRRKAKDRSRAKAPGDCKKMGSWEDEKIRKYEKRKTIFAQRRQVAKNGGECVALRAGNGGR
jgi:hypothetical protein